MCHDFFATDGRGLLTDADSIAITVSRTAREREWGAYLCVGREVRDIVDGSLEIYIASLLA